MAIGKITSKSLDSNAVTSTNLAPGAVTIADIADGEITAGKLHTTLDLSTKTLTLTQASVTAHQAALSVTQSQISDLSTTTDLSEGTNLYYTNARADARVALLVDSAPGTLNTLNELAAALGDDPNFATTTANNIATKLPLAGGTMTGTLNVTQASTADTIKLTRGTTAHNNMIKFVTGSTDKWIVGQRNDNTDHFRFYSYGTSSDVLSIQTDGNVGIGTTSPDSPLVVNSSSGGNTVKMIGRAADNISSLTFSNAGNTASNYIQGNSSFIRARADGGFHFRKGGTPVTTDTGAFTVNGLNVGIGITNPAQLLHVQAGSTGNGTIRVGGGAGLEISHDNAGVTVQRIDSIYRTTSADANLQLRTGILTFHTGASSTERVRIDAGGTVSIQSLPGTTSSGISGASGGSLDLNGGTAFAGRLLLTGYNDSGSNLIGLNNESSGLVMYDYTDSQYIMRTNNDQKVSFGGGFPNVNGSSNGAYNIIVDDGICIGDGGYTHGYVGTNGTDGDVYIAANAYPANLSSDRSVRIAAGSPGGGGPNEIVRYNHSHGAIRNYNNNTTTNKKWWSTTSGNFGEVEEYDYGNKLYFKKTRAVGGYSQMLLLNRYMPNQYDVSFELVSPLDTVTYRHFGIALNHVGSETFNFDYLVLRQRFGNSANNQVRIDRPAGTVGTTEGSSIPNFHDGTKRKIMIQKRASTFRMQVHELNGSVYTYGTISGISWTNSSGYFGFGIYEPTGTNTWAKISNLTITDVIG